MNNGSNSVARTTRQGVPLDKGVHSEWVYKRFEAVSEGIIDFKLEGTGEESRTLVRIRNMRNVGFSSQWHLLRIAENFEVTLEK